MPDTTSREHLPHCQHCGKLIRPAVVDLDRVIAGERGLEAAAAAVPWWEDMNGITVCLKLQDGDSGYVHHKPMPEVTP